MIVETVRDVLSAGPVGWVIVASPCVALALAAAAFATSAKPAGRPAALGALGALALGALAAWAEVFGARARFAEHVLHPERAPVPAKAGLAAAAELGRAIASQAFGAGTTAALAPVVFAALALAWSRAEKGPVERARAWALALGLAAPITLTAIVLWRAATSSVFSFGLDPAARYEQLMAMYDAVEAARGWVVVVAALAGAAAVALAWRAETPSRAVRWAGVLLGCAGALAFAATRARASDASRPLSYVRGEPWTTADAPLAPASDDCVALEDARDPRVTVHSDGHLDVDGIDVRDAAELETVMRAKVSLRASILRAPADRFELAAAVGADQAQVGAAIAACARAGASRPRWLAARATPSVETATLGRLDRPPRLCAVGAR